MTQASTTEDLNKFNEVRDKNAQSLHQYKTGFFVTTKSLILWVLMLLSTIILGLLTITLAIFRAQNTIHKVASFWGSTMSKITGNKLVIHGAQNLYTDGSSLVIANHQSICDIFVLYSVLKKIQFRWMAKSNLFKIPILGWAMSGAGYIRVDRSNKKKALQSMFDAAKEIKNGKSVIVFPEGTTGHNDGSMIPFKKGAFLLAKKSQSVIQPITQFGANHIIPEQQGRWIQRIYSGTVHIYIHPPILPEEYENSSMDELKNQLRTIIEKPLLDNHFS